jgi:ABC-type multidrug transport system ATPase subunit
VEATDRALVEVQHLHKRYRDTVAVEDVSLTVEAGEIVGIVGPNGAGKSITVELIQGLRAPDRGRVRVLGLDPWRDRDELRQRVGAQLQQSDLYDKRPWSCSPTPRWPSWTSSAPASTPTPAATPGG